MELHPENVVALHRSGKCPAVLRASDCAFNHRSTVGVGVIDKGAALNTAQQARLAADLNLVPADMRRLDRSREARAFARKKSCARCPRRFSAALKQPLHPDADSQKRFARSNTLQHI